jgi:hypothetical protein
MNDSTREPTSPPTAAHNVNDDASSGSSPLRASSRCTTLPATRNAIASITPKL